jgi:hypothetical protein
MTTDPSRLNRSLASQTYPKSFNWWVLTKPAKRGEPPKSFLTIKVDKVEVRSCPAAEAGLTSSAVRMFICRCGELTKTVCGPN